MTKAAKALALVLVWFAVAGVSLGKRHSPITYATDWRPSIVAVWEFEGESAGGNALDSGTGANDTMTNVGTTGRDTSVPAHGQQDATIVSGTNYFSSTATGLNPAGASFTYGCFARPTVTSANPRYIFDKSLSNAGYNIYFRPTASSSAIRMEIGRAGPGTVTCNQTDANAEGAWRWVVATVDTTSGVVLKCYRDAGATFGTITHANAYQATTTTAFLGSSTTGQLDANLDDCFFDFPAWTQQQIAKAGACGLDGKDCACDFADNTLYRVCTTSADCGEGICADSAVTQTQCADAGEKCCMGYLNATVVSGSPTISDQAMPACNSAAP